MASVRNLKKDIDYLVFEVISDCFGFGEIHPDSQPEEVTGIISDAVNFRNDLIRRVNNPEKDNTNKVVKGYFRDIEIDLIKGVDALFSRLSALSVSK